MLPQGQPGRRSGRISLKWVIVGGVAGLLVGIPVAFVIYQRLSVPDIGEPYDVQAFLKYSVPDEENAYAFYRDAAARLQTADAYGRTLTAQDADGPGTFLEALQKAQAEGLDAADGRVRGWVEANHNALETWLAGTKLEQALEVHPRNLTAVSSLAVTQSCRELARLAVLAGDRAAASGDQDEAWTWYAATLRSSRHLGMHAPMVGRLVGVAVHAVAGLSIVRWSANPDVTPEQLRRALADVRAIDAMTPPSSDSLKCEYISTSSALQFLLSGSQTVIFGMSGEATRTQRLMKLAFANWLTQCDLPRNERAAVHPGSLGLFEIGKAQADDPKLRLPADIERWSRQGFIGGRLIATIMPAIKQYDIAIGRERMKQRALELALALQIHFREHGKFPESLDALVGDSFEAVPLDPFGKGEPLRYRLEEGGGVTIWSVGADGVDQGGDETVPSPEKGDLVVRIRRPSAEAK